MEEIPVYLFTGFLESGKTSFIQDALEGDDFNAGERTLLLLCEEGVEEYDTERFNRPNVFIEVIERESDLTPSHLEALQKKHDILDLFLLLPACFDPVYTYFSYT